MTPQAKLFTSPEGRRISAEAKSLFVTIEVGDRLVTVTKQPLAGQHGSGIRRQFRLCLSWSRSRMAPR